jgi:hypothetical protein
MNNELAAEIQAEQDYGRQKYGRRADNFAHDDAHTPQEWASFVVEMARRAAHETPIEYRQRMVKVAGLACSAIEAFDRTERRERLRGAKVERSTQI